MKRLLSSILILLLLLVAVMVGRTISRQGEERRVLPAPELSINAKTVCGRLTQAIRIQSISTSVRDALRPDPLEELVDFLIRSYPPIFTRLSFERQQRSLVLRWPGKEKDLAPILLLAHLDVVPVDFESLDEWSQPPFSGAVSGGYVWGRGALDDKSRALAMLEAVQLLIGEGFVPRREVILAFGLDEEIGGAEGAARTAEHFAAEGLAPALILDEGLAILEGLVPGVAAPVAAVGIAEKGRVVVELTVDTAGGHASMPPEQSAVGVLAAAVVALESTPMPAAYDGTTRLFFESLAPWMPFGHRMVFANAWITVPLIEHELGKDEGTGALLRTTTAVTTCAGGLASNVLPQNARATVDFRIHPRDSSASVLEHVQEAIDDPRVTVTLLGEATEPSPPSPVGDEAWWLLERTIRECFEGVHVAPGLVLGGTDSRHYRRLSPNVYRFSPMRVTAQDLARIHGVDERISVHDYLQMIRFFVQLLRNA